MSLQQFRQRDDRFDDHNGREETGWLEVGELELNGPLWIGDPYTVQRQLGFTVRLPRGSYRVEGRGLVDDQGFPRVSRLRIVSDAARAFRVGDKLGDCGTDTAMLALCDIDEVERVAEEVETDDIRERVFDAADAGCGAIEIYPRGEMLRLIFSHTGYGDGTFPVLPLRDGAHTVGVELEFIT
jgi:hypothetical protein